MPPKSSSGGRKPKSDPAISDRNSIRNRRRIQGGAQLRGSGLPGQANHGIAMQNAHQCQGSKTCRHTAITTANSPGTDNPPDAQQPSGALSGSQGNKNKNVEMQHEVSSSAGNNGNLGHVQGLQTGLGRPNQGIELRLLPKRPPRDRFRLPEPALTAKLPMERRQHTSPEDNSEDNSKLLILAAVAEEYLRDLGPNCEADNSHDNPLRGQGDDEQRDKDEPSRNSSKQILPSLRHPHTGHLADPNYHKHLPPLNKVVREVVARTFGSLNPAQKANFRGSLKKLAEANAAKRNQTAGKQQNVPSGHQDAVAGGNQRAVNDPSNSQSGCHLGYRAKKTQTTTTNGTPKTVNLRRLRDRGHKTGFVSFGEYVQADMPSPALSHFSTMATPRTAKNQGMIKPPAGARVGTPSFNVFQAFLRRPELVIMLAKRLRVQELLTLYSICRPFHNIVKLRLSSVIVSQAMRRAPESAKLFPFRCYRKLCVEDPAGRPHPVAERAAKGEIRKIPSFRWLRMVCFREMVCHEIMVVMAEDGVAMPDHCEAILKKIWFLMDVPDTPRRLELVQNPGIWTDADIFFAVLFFVKADMRFTDPITGSGKDGMRRLLLAQLSLSVFWRTLKRTALMGKAELLKLYIRWRREPRPVAGISAFLGVSPEDLGAMQYEAWGRSENRDPLEPLDDMLMAESLRRGLPLEEQYPDMFLWGYVNPNTLENIPPVVHLRDLDRMEGWEQDLVSGEDQKHLLVLTKNPDQGYTAEGF